MKVGNNESIRLALRLVPILVGVYFFVSCLTNAQVKSDRERDDLFGSVHIVRMEKVVLSAVKTSDQNVEVEQVTYNEKGDKTEETLYNSDGSSLLNKSIFDYDDSRQLKSVTVYNADGSIHLKRLYSQTSSSGLKRTEESIYGGGSSLVSKASHLYDSNGRPIELVNLDANGKLQDRIVTSYDSSGRTSDVTYFHDENTVWTRLSFVYDSKGNLMEMHQYEADGSLASKNVFSGDTERGTDITMAEYDSKGYLVGKERYIREFDSHGNWIKETQSKLNKQSGAWDIVQTTKRQITYY